MPVTWPLAGSTRTFDATACAITRRLPRSAWARDFCALYLAWIGQIGVHAVLPGAALAQVAAERLALAALVDRADRLVVRRAGWSCAPPGSCGPCSENGCPPRSTAIPSMAAASTWSE